MVAPANWRQWVRGSSGLWPADTANAGFTLTVSPANTFSVCGWTQYSANTLTGAWQTIFATLHSGASYTAFLIDNPATGALGMEYAGGGVWRVDAWPTQPGPGRPFFWFASIVMNSVSGNSFCGWADLRGRGSIVANTWGIDDSGGHTQTGILTDDWQQRLRYAAAANVMVWSGIAHSRGFFAEQMRAAYPLTSRGLWAWWPLEGGETGMILDRSGNRRTLLIPGARNTDFWIRDSALPRGLLTRRLVRGKTSSLILPPHARDFAPDAQQIFHNPR